MDDSDNRFVHDHASTTAVQSDMCIVIRCLGEVIFSNDGVSILSDINPLHWSQLYDGMCVSTLTIKQDYSHLATFDIGLSSWLAIFDWMFLTLSSVPFNDEDK